MSKVVLVIIGMLLATTNAFAEVIYNRTPGDPSRVLISIPDNRREAVEVIIRDIPNPADNEIKITATVGDDYGDMDTINADCVVKGNDVRCEW
jgi:hypothetical protein